MLRQISPSKLIRQISPGSLSSNDQKVFFSLRSSIQDSFEARSTYDDTQEVKHSVVDNVWFQGVVTTLTLMNTAQMGFEADYPEWKGAWVICENVFTAAFFLEMIVKLKFMRLNYFKDKANCLDCALVILGIIDAWILSNLPISGGADLQALSILRILRLARLARILKLIRAFKPLVLVIQGIRATLSTLGYVFALLVLIFYVFAILLKQSLGEPGNADMYPGYSTDQEAIDMQEVMMNYNPAIYFGSMWLSMVTLFNMATFNEWQDVVRPLALRQPAYVAIFICYALLVAFGVMNVMTGLIVDSVIAEAKNLEEAHAENELKAKVETLENVQMLLKAMDVDGDGVISKEELHCAMKNNSLFTQLLSDINLPPAWSADELMAMLDTNGDDMLEKDEFTTGFFRLLVSDHFQQSCILQASINQVKCMVNSGNEAIQRNILAMQAEIRSIKSVLCPATQGQAEPAADNPNVLEDTPVEPCRSSYQPFNPCPHGKHMDAKKAANDELVGERIEHISHTLLIESLDAAYTVMKESFRLDLASMKISLETDLVNSKQASGDVTEMRHSDCTSRSGAIDGRSTRISAHNHMRDDEAPTVLLNNKTSLQSAYLNLATKGQECREGSEICIESLDSLRHNGVVDNGCTVQSATFVPPVRPFSPTSL